MSNMSVGTSTTSTTEGTSPAAMPAGLDPAKRVPTRRHRRLSTETKSAFKTTELLAYIGAVVAVAVASQTIGSDTGAGNGDYFRADKAFLYITILTVGYLLSRGIAKSGSRDFYDDED